MKCQFWIFYGYFSVDNDTNLVTSFYETINGLTNFNNNILVDVGTVIMPYNYGARNTNIFVSPYFTDNGTLINVTPFQLFGDTINQIALGYNVIVAMFPWDESKVEYITFFANNNSYFLSNGYWYQTENISNPSCFNEGTKILCLNKNLEEEYIPIENLGKGDLVKSYKHGYRKIDLIGKNPMINNPNRFNECMYKMEKTEENGLLDDLIITGGHSILVHDLAEYKEENDKIFGTTYMIDDKYLLLSAVSNDFKKIENTNVYTYYHFILENNENDDERFGVWANGILTETPSKNQFTNHKYTLL